MTIGAPRIPILIDINVQHDLAAVFADRGHQVTFALHALDETASDEAIAGLADDLGAVVVSWDKDFSHLIARAAIGRRQPFRHAGRISFAGCRYQIGQRRLERHIDVIEVE